MHKALELRLTGAQGKDSVRYLQEHAVLPDAYDAIGRFSKGESARVRTSVRR